MNNAKNDFLKKVEEKYKHLSAEEQLVVLKELDNFLAEISTKVKK